MIETKELGQSTAAAAPATAHCPACGAETAGPFCSGCGQGKVQRLSIPGILARSVNKLILFDFKVVRTFKALLRRPGEMIRQYVSGKRNTYANPRAYALLTVTGFALLDRLVSSPLGRMFDPVLGAGALAPYLGIILMLPVAVGMRVLLRKRDLNLAECYAFLLYVGGQIVLF